MKRAKMKIAVFAAAIIILLGFLEYKGLIWHNSIFAMNYKVRGLDVSHYQGEVDWGKAAESGKYQYVYMKATEGHDFTDDTFVQNWEGAKESGMRVGACHFFSSRSPGEQQAALKEKRDWVFWQYCNRGRIAGIDAYVDINVFNGDQAAFD